VLVGHSVAWRLSPFPEGAGNVYCPSPSTQTTNSILYNFFGNKFLFLSALVQHLSLNTLNLAIQGLAQRNSQGAAEPVTPSSSPRIANSHHLINSPRNRSVVQHGHLRRTDKVFVLRYHTVSEPYHDGGQMLVEPFVRNVAHQPWPMRARSLPFVLLYQFMYLVAVHGGAGNHPSSDDNLRHALRL
jgi:hypothetical protein